MDERISIDIPTLWLEVSDLIGDEACQLGQYWQNIRCARDLLEFAFANGVLNEEQAKVFIYDFQQASNAYEVLKIRGVLTRMMYLEAIDYSEILFRNWIIDRVNRDLLAENISKGEDWAKEDLAIADQLESSVFQISRTLSKGEPFPYEEVRNHGKLLNRCEEMQKENSKLV